jgi:hypothetical protein
MEGIEKAIMAAVEAAKLRKYVRDNGAIGLAGLTRLADRHSADSAAALGKIGGRTAREIIAAHPVAGPAGEHG